VLAKILLLFGIGRKPKPVVIEALPDAAAAVLLAPVAPPSLTEMLQRLIDELGGPLVELDREAWGSLAPRVVELADTVPPPSFPRVASQVHALASKPDLDLNELVGLVQRDAAIATTLLRYANSPLIAPSSPITTLRGAIHLLGMRQVVELVLGASGRSFYEVASPEEIALFPDLWQTMFDEAMANAFSAGRLALDIRGARGERALLAGLLADVGRPIALRILARLIREGLEQPSLPIILATLDEVSARIGEHAIGRMSLPEELRVACVRDPELPTADASIARLIASVGAIQRRSPRIWGNAAEVRETAEQLHVTPYALRALFAQRTQHVAQAREMFRGR
jgi:HD-like signal output (HDOD) protein